VDNAIHELAESVTLSLGPALTTYRLDPIVANRSGTVTLADND